jgi:RpiB/LacA/LacB family sugar-phosphate isomerase
VIIMKVAVASDHGGLPLKNVVIETIKTLNFDIVDLGTNSEISSDYPDFAKLAAEALLKGQVDRSIVMCGSGVGVCIASNKIKGIYASVCHDTYSAHQGVEHDGMNTLCLGGRVIGAELAAEIVRAFLLAKPMQGENYRRRIKKVKAIEEEV